MNTDKNLLTNCLLEYPQFPDYDVNWWPASGSSWGYYVNSGDYKINYENESLFVDILVAGLNKEDIEAYLENGTLRVKSSKPGWNGNLNLYITLTSYKIDFENVIVRLINGVLRVEFKRKDEKIKLEIE